jgi:DNA-binding transcriptional ArsR family regulator
MSISLMTDVWRLPLQASRKMVLLALADNANDEGTDCWPSIGKLVEKCSMSERSIQVHLAALEDSGYIKRHERLGRSNKFTVYVERVRAELYKKTTDEKRQFPSASAKRERIEAPPQNLHPPSSNPHSTHTPAESAPPHVLHPTPAESAPITTREPSLKTTTTSSDALESCGGDLSMQKLHYPVCSQEESIAIAQLLSACPTEFRQQALDEIEGARQAGVIKTNLVPFARGVVRAIARGEFTVGHGANIASKRKLQIKNARLTNSLNIRLDPEAISKGMAFMNRINQ